MDFGKDQFWITLLSIAAGAIGYLIATFWVGPILRYRNIRNKVAADLIFFANAIQLQKLDGTAREDTLARKDANRRRVADLVAINNDLPPWYRWWLVRRNEDPKRASPELIGLSNESDPRKARVRVEKVKKYLGISPAGG
jgi:hypothetical protein